MKIRRDENSQRLERAERPVNFLSRSTTNLRTLPVGKRSEVLVLSK